MLAQMPDTDIERNYCEAARSDIQGQRYLRRVAIESKRTSSRSTSSSLA